MVNYSAHPCHIHGCPRHPPPYWRSIPATGTCLLASSDKTWHQDTGEQCRIPPLQLCAIPFLIQLKNPTTQMLSGNNKTRTGQVSSEREIYISQFQCQHRFHQHAEKFLNTKSRHKILLHFTCMRCRQRYRNRQIKHPLQHNHQRRPPPRRVLRFIILNRTFKTQRLIRSIPFSAGMFTCALFAHFRFHFTQA